MKLTAIPKPVALRVDNTVGTRVFADNTMIYGDTGIVRIDHLLLNGWVSNVPEWPVQVRRLGNIVDLRGYVYKLNATSANLLELPSGFGVGNVSPNQVHGIVAGTTMRETFHLRLRGRGLSLPNYEIWTQPQMFIHATWTTNEAWPTILS